MRAKARLEDLFVPRVDAVGVPANRRRFLLLKQEVSEMPEAPAVEERKEGLTAEQQEQVKRALELLYPLFEEGLIPDVAIVALGKLVGYPLPEGVKPYPSPYPSPYPQKTCSDSTSPDLLPKEETPKEASPQAVEKAEEKIPQEIELLQKAKDELQKELEALRKALEEERSIREKKEFVEAIKSEIPSIMALTPEIADLLFSFRDAGANKAIESLKKLEAVVAASPLFKELGSSGHIEESPWDVLDRQARELLNKGQAKTIEAARVLVLTQNPELYWQLRG